MVELIFVIAIIAFVCKKAGVALSEADKVEVLNKRNQNWGAGSYQASRQATRVDSPRTQVNQQNAQWKKAAQENIAKAKQRAQQKISQTLEYVENEHFQQADMHRQQENRQAMQQVHASRMEARNTTILQRAKANAEEDKVDVTLETMEAEHNHSERVSAAIHHHPEDDIPDSMLGTVEDLMVKGFDGNLCFERDFVGEGLDMISRFSYQ